MTTILSTSEIATKVQFMDLLNNLPPFQESGGGGGFFSSKRGEIVK